MAPILYRNFKAEEISYGPIREMQTGGRQVPINYSNQLFTLQTPEMRIPFGIQDVPVGQDQAPVKNKKIIEFSMDDDDFLKMMTELDKKILDGGVANAVAWLRRPKKGDTPREVVEALYTSMVKYPVNKETGERKPYPPVLKSNIMVNDGKLQCEVFHKNKDERLDINAEGFDLRGARATAILQCAGVWLVGNRFGVSWRLKQLRVTSMSAGRNATTYAFVDDEPTAASRIEAPPRVLGPAAATEGEDFADDFGMAD
jgi:hypothetical protein